MTHSDLTAMARTGEVEKSRTALWPLLVLGLSVTNAVAVRSVFSPVQEIAARDLQFSDQQMGLIQGLAASIPIALLAMPIGRVTDYGNRRRLLLGLALMWSLGGLLTAFASGFWAVFAARTLAASGSFCVLIVAISMAADYSTPGVRGRALFGVSLGNSLGAAAAFAFGGALLGQFSTNPGVFGALEPWRVVQLVFAGASVLLTLLILTIREPARSEQSATGSVTTAVALREIWARRGLIAPLFLGQISVVMADSAATIWAAPVLTRSYGLQPEDFTGWMALVLLASGIVGGVLGGIAADYGHKSKLKGGILVGGVAAAALSIPGGLFAVMPSTDGFAVLLGLLLVCGAVTGLVSSAVTAVLIPNEIRGVCLAAFFVIGSVVGLGVAPSMVVWISDQMGGANNLRFGLAITSVVASLLATVGYSASMLSVRRDA